MAISDVMKETLKKHKAQFECLRWDSKLFVLSWVNLHRAAFSISETENTTIINEASSNIKDMALKFSAVIKVKGTDVMDVLRE